MTEDQEPKTEDRGQRTEQEPEILTMERASEPSPALMEQLTMELRAEPALCAQLLTALKTKRYMVTVHFKVKDSPPDDLMHGLTHQGYPIAEMAPSLDHVKGMLPKAGSEQPGADNWR